MLQPLLTQAGTERPKERFEVDLLHGHTSKGRVGTLGVHEQKYHEQISCSC
jgi:hypothetical protein